MKIGELKQHCGACDIIEFCGNAFCYCICNQSCFKNIDVEMYKKYAEEAKTTSFPSCTDCQNDDCEMCEIDDEARSYYCRQVSEYVTVMIEIENGNGVGLPPKN